MQYHCRPIPAHYYFFSSQNKIDLTRTHRAGQVWIRRVSHKDFYVGQGVELRRTRCLVNNVMHRFPQYYSTKIFFITYRITIMTYNQKTSSIDQITKISEHFIISYQTEIAIMNSDVLPYYR